MMKHYLLTFAGLILCTGILVAQPANDNCSAATPMNYSDTEASVVRVSGDTRDALPDSTAGLIVVCSGSWWYDDIWFSLTTPAVIPDHGIVIRAYFGGSANDVSSVGMAFYGSCDAEATAYTCFSSDQAADDSLAVRPECLSPNTTYLVRVWSGGSPNMHSGTFEIGAFANPNSTKPDNILWEETFGDGLDGWSTFGFCGDPDSSGNAMWHYLPGGLIDMGAYITPGYHMLSSTACDGAVGVDADFDDNGGDPNDPGSGPCPAIAQYRLVSPVLPHGDWDAEGISVVWTQAIRQFLSAYFVGHRIYENGEWGDWRFREVNTEYPDNDPTDHVADVQNLYLVGAENGDSIQIQFIYNANYYFWAIDDVLLVEAPCVDLTAATDFYAFGPAVQIPASQAFPWWPLNDVTNNGGCNQANVVLNCSVWNGASEKIYDRDHDMGTIPPGGRAENENFLAPVDLSGLSPDTYTGQYTATSDLSNESTDADFADNINTFGFETTEGTYALETGSTRLVAVSDAIYDDGAPLSYAFGNHFYFPNGAQYKLTAVTWGVGNASEIAGLANTSVSLVLYKWTDANSNEVAEASERIPVGFADVVFDGSEPDDLILDTELENASKAGEPIIFEDNARYLMMVEYAAGTQTFFFLMASEEYNYGANVLSSAQAGLPMYAAVLGFNSAGDIAGIDYEVTELSLEDDRVYFGWDLVPVVRLNIEPTTSAVDDVLPADHFAVLYPNPAADKVYLELDLAETADHVQVVLFDATGKSLFIRQYRHLSDAVLEFDISTLPAGPYTLHLNTEHGSRAMPVVVQR